MKLSAQITELAQAIAEAERALEELAAFDFTGLSVIVHADHSLTDAAQDRLSSAVIVNREAIREIAINQARTDLSDAIRQLKEISRHLEYPIR